MDALSDWFPVLESNQFYIFTDIGIFAIKPNGELVPVEGIEPPNQVMTPDYTHQALGSGLYNYRAQHRIGNSLRVCITGIVGSP